ncbi:uncharacterized protein Triagg1_1387 [Trichoderma aggressivum f. europaeum]|uniref:Uncharacterized protein n=1 Tax=Trichoderma aggressivum f. europaeum TaxID=173218 RepID=A0AAE1M947_9HYPO|nr:hypothetical protein Triagg1_1387 [Trichoderma aggressivum f. europaeum]
MASTTSALRRRQIAARIRLSEMLNELELDHECKLVQAIRELPLTETIRFCNEWESITPDERAARLERLHRDAQNFNSIYMLNGVLVTLMPDCRQGQPASEQTVNPTNESTESESTESSEEDDSDEVDDDSEEEDSSDDDDSSDEDMDVDE